MPTYEYECTRCGLVFEEFKPMSAPRRERCPECRGKVERLISGGMGVVFKGSGFYKTDSRATTGGGKAASADGGSAAPDAPAVNDTPKPAADKGQSEK
jgi:putative FmdB family regulatory protein